MAMVRWNLTQWTFFTVMSWWGCGMVATVAGLGGWIYPILSLFLIFPISGLVGAFSVVGRYFFSKKSDPYIQLLLLGLSFIWLLHFSGVLVPETGFDAVWYHLPLAKTFVDSHQFLYVKDFSQSLNPLFSEAVFMLGFQIGQDLGTKLVAYGISITLLLVIYQLAKRFLSTRQALLSCLLISTFQVISWQASSFYIDTTKALWEIAAVWLTIDAFLQPRKSDFPHWIAIGMLWGASVASKQFSLVLVPFIVIASWWVSKSARLTFFSLLTLFLVALPHYLRPHLILGNPFASISSHLNQSQIITGTQTIGEHITKKFLTMPWSVFELAFLSRDYVTVLIFPGIILLLFKVRHLINNKSLLLLSVFVLNQWIVWWFVPPTSTRYALSGFICLAILIMSILFKTSLSKRQQALGYQLIFLGIVINMLPRLVTTYRNLHYLLSGTPKETYLQKFMDGHIDQPLKKWHKLQ
jgi:hypothetical protein